jgi:prepilin signal peptidase PulO-like enzyme (type II secretory pathway)
LEIILIFLFFLIGMSVGSFLNVVADRVPLKQSIVSPPSHCFSCGHVLDWKDMFPVISYIALRGKCRYCHASITPRSMIIEIVTGLFFVLAWLRFGVGVQLVTVIIYTAIFTVIIITALENQRMPAIFVYAASAFALVLAAAHPFTQVGPGFMGSVAGFAAGFGLAALAWIIFKWTGKGIFGFWNVWVIGMIGASIGFPLIVASLLTGTIIIVTVWLIMRRRSYRIPVAAILCSAAMIFLYMGELFFDKIWPFKAFWI